MAEHYEPADCERNSVIMTNEGRVADIEVFVDPETYKVLGLVTGTNCDNGYLHAEADSRGGFREAELLARSLRQMADAIEALLKGAL